MEKDDRDRELQRLAIPKSSSPTRRIQSPYTNRLPPAFHVTGHAEDLDVEAAAHVPEEHKQSWHRYLEGFVMAAAGVLSVVGMSPVAISPMPVNVTTTSTVTPPGAGALQAAFPVSQADLDEAIKHVTAGRLQSADPVYGIRPTPVQNELVVHINQHIDGEADRIVDIVVETQQVKASEADVKDARDFVRQLVRSVLDHLSNPSKLGDDLASNVVGGWSLLQYMRKRFRESEKAKHNPVLTHLSQGFDKLSEIFDPSGPGQPKRYPISFLAQQLKCSEEEATAILMAGPFIESSPGVWELRGPIGLPENRLRLDPHVLENLKFSF